MRRIAALIAVLLSSAALAQKTGPAPAGEAKQVATRVIAAAGHPCPKVVKASRNPDGSITAVCSNREDYRVFAVEGVGDIAMKCSAARKLGVGGC